MLSRPALLLCLLAGACATAPPPVVPPPGAAALFDCLRINRLTVVSAHRAGPGPGLPENAIETIEAAAVAGLAVVEIDIARTSDGVLVLMHDAMLDRTTTGTGPLAARAWADLQTLQLKDNDGTVTSARIPTLAAALATIKARKMVAQLDLKRDSGVTEAQVAAAVRTAGVERQVAIITYTKEQALAAAKADPAILVSASIADAGAVAELAAAGLASNRLLAWTGTRAPDAPLWSALRADGVEVIFGTLGRPGQRLDDVYATDGDVREYVDLAAMGATMIATDAPQAAEAVLRAARGGVAVTAKCPVPGEK